jgi:hypothetical protein
MDRATLVANYVQK